MSIFQNKLNYRNIAVRLIVMSKNDVLLNKKVPKRESLRDIFRNEGLKKGKQ